MSETTDQKGGEVDAPKRGHLARNVFFLLLGQAASTVLAIGLNAVLGRHLSPADFGIYYVVTSMSVFAFVLVDWGQTAYLIREVARRPADQGRLLGSALLFRAVVAVVAAVATVVAARVMGYEGPVQFLAGFTVLAGLPLALSQAFGLLFRGRNRMDLDASVTVTVKALSVALAVPALLAGGQLAAVIGSQGLAGLGGLMLAFLLARRAGLAKPAPSRSGLLELAHGGTPLAVFFVAVSVQPYIDAIVLSKLVPAEVVGWYGAARNLMGVLVAPAAILGAASFPELSRSADDLPALRAAIRRAMRPLVALGALGAVGTYVFADFAIGLIFGKGRFAPAVGVLHIFAPSMFMLFVDFLLGNVVTALGRTRRIAVVKVANVLVSTGLSLVLIPWFQEHHGNGGEGLVAAFGISEVIMLVGYLWLIPRGALDAALLLDVGRALLAGLVTIGVLLALPALSPWILLPICLALFAALCVATGLVRLDEVGRLRGMLQRGQART